MTHSVLIAHSLNWPNAARLAISFKKAGFRVMAVAPSGHPLHRMSSPERTFIYRSWRPRESLRRAIAASQPQLIIPCDDRIVINLQALHAAALKDGDLATSRLIEDSLGSPESFAILSKRSLLGRLSALPETHVPRTDPIANIQELTDWIEAHGLPAMLKLDRTTGGHDVIALKDRAAALRSFLIMRMRRSAVRWLRRALSKRDAEIILDHFRNEPRGVSIQSFVTGRPANCAVACWRGRVLAFVAVEVVQARSEFGVATVVKPIECAAMKAAAMSVVERLQISGMCGFDFILDDLSGEAKLIELNPRATQINHLASDCGLDLATALRRALDQEAQGPARTAVSPEPIALFPQEWLRDPHSPHLRRAVHDVPLDEPELLKFYGYAHPVDAPPAGAGEARASCQAVVLRDGPADAPLFLWPGIDCNVEEVRALAQSFNGERAVYGLEFRFLTEEAVALATVEEIAARAIAQMRAIQPRGPYRLAGYSFGGMVAFEAALQLMASGADVALLALVATPIAQRFWPLPVLLRSAVRRTTRHLRDSLRQPIGAAAPILAKRVARIGRLAAQRIVLNTLLAPLALQPSAAPSVRGRIAMEKYRPGFFPGRLTIIQPTDDRELFCDFSRLWRSHAERLNVKVLAANHVDFVHDLTTSGRVAEFIDRLLSENADPTQPVRPAAEHPDLISLTLARWPSVHQLP